jgi:hypothetical protein
MFIYFILINNIFALIFWITILGYSTLLFLPKNFKKDYSVKIKVYLDDERLTPQGWERAYTYDECLDFLKTFKVSHLSLDHDLGTEKTGYDVIKWIEEQVFNNINYNPPIITIHSANPAGRNNIELALISINRIIDNR